MATFLTLFLCQHTDNKKKKKYKEDSYFKKYGNYLDIQQT